MTISFDAFETARYHLALSNLKGAEIILKRGGKLLGSIRLCYSKYERYPALNGFSKAMLFRE